MGALKQHLTYAFVVLPIFNSQFSILSFQWIGFASASHLCCRLIR